MREAAVVVKEYTGDGKAVDFVDVINFYNDQLKEEDKPLFLSFVYATALKGRAKLVFSEKPSSIKELSTTLLQRFKPRTTIAEVTMKIGQCYQGSRTVSRFASELEALNSELLELQLAKQGMDAKGILMAINEDTLLSAFKRGLNPSLQAVVVAANLDKFRTAVDMALEAETAHSGDAAVVNDLDRTHPKNTQRGNSNFRGHWQGNRPRFGQPLQYNNNNWSRGGQQGQHFVPSTVRGPNANFGQPRNDWYGNKPRFGQRGGFWQGGQPHQGMQRMDFNNQRQGQVNNYQGHYDNQEQFVHTDGDSQAHYGPADQCLQFFRE